MLIVRTPDGRLTFLQAIGSRRKGSVGGGIPAAFTGHLITDGYTGYQHLLSRIAGIQQCAQHVIRRCRAVMKLGPGGVQNWAGDIIAVLGQAHRAVEDARARGSTELDQQVLDNLRERYDQAAGSGRIHNRLRDWDTGNRPGYALACWLRDYKEQVFLFTRDFAVSWTNNVSERGAKAAKRHQAVPATGIPCPPSPAGAPSGATSTQPPPTASPHSTPSAAPSRESPGYHHSPHSPDTNSRDPVNGHILTCRGGRPCGRPDNLIDEILSSLQPERSWLDAAEEFYQLAAESGSQGMAAVATYGRRGRRLEQARLNVAKWESEARTLAAGQSPWGLW